MSQQDYPLYFKITVKLFLLFLIVAVLMLARDLLIPLTISIFFTFLLLPISNRLIRWRFPRWLAIIISIILAMGLFGLLIYFFYYQVASFSDDLPALRQALDTKIQRLQSFINENFHISRREQLKWIDEKVKETAGSGDEYLLGLFSATTNVMASFALIPIYVFFLTIYKEKYKTFIVIISGDRDHENILAIIKKVTSVSQNYLKGLFFDVLILAILNSTGFVLLGIEHAILFGVLAALLNIIPYVGVLIGSILPILMALLTKDEISYAIGVAGVCMLVQFLDNNFITPYVVGSSVSINPLTATIALVASAMMWGLPGMVLCMPVTGMIKVICDHVEPLKPFGFVIGEDVNYRSREHIQDKLFKKLKKK